MGLWDKFLYSLDVSLPSIIVDGVSMLRYDAERELVSLDDKISCLHPDELSCTASEYRLQLVRAAQAVSDRITADPSLNAVLTDKDRRMLQVILDSSTTGDES